MIQTNIQITNKRLIKFNIIISNYSDLINIKYAQKYK